MAVVYAMLCRYGVIAKTKSIDLLTEIQQNPIPNVTRAGILQFWVGMGTKTAICVRVIKQNQTLKFHIIKSHPTEIVNPKPRFCENFNMLQLL